MYEIFLKLLEEKGVSAYKVGKATGIAGSTFTDWKTGRSAPKQDKLQKIADYFGVTLDYLMTGEEQNSPYSDDMADLFVEISRSNDVNRIKRLLSYYMNLNEREKDSVDSIVESLSNKDNPKKNG
ncbi:helix-turn-helix domain-containing protein [Roseburia hominis]|jgi:transcriptional regulator with XRE-family HTH domain|uniref:helix-turn-helix domain-containing protein n=1 Tax=Roseburia hominis TaxID=301301 RepID=UPI001C02DC6D|nr:helix-turn-helix transcriptional regulator [Roseburia hominis]MBT9667138.1 helix-turn-helix domain-containing protein [Roseburia hominis]